MSTLGNAALLVGAGALQTLLIRQGRSIAGIIPNLVIEESHSDELSVTEHPIEQGASISDHAFKTSSQVTCRYGWGAGGILSGAPTVQDVYDQLLQLQATREPFSLVTGKRSYENMLMKALSVTTDAGSENSLMVTVTFKQVIIVQTSTTTLQPSVVHANPAKTAQIDNNGTKQPQAVSVSIAYKTVSQVKSLINGGGQ
jgi:hypothetical protein